MSIAEFARKKSPALSTLSAHTTLGQSAHVRIEPSTGWVSINLKELWRYRELIYFFAWRDIKVRYKQTLLGAAWAIIQPIFTMVVFSVLFGRLAKMPSEGVPYPIFCFAALLPWGYFANALSQGSSSVVRSSQLIKKVYFPRLAIPLSSVLSGVVDFALSFLVLLCMMSYFGIAPTWNIVWLPFFLVLAIVMALGTSLWLTSLNVKFRDVSYTVPFLTQMWMFFTPIIYPSSVLPEPWRTLYGLNPLAGVIEGFRWALLGTNTKPGLMLIVSSVTAIAILVSGAFYFRRVEKTFADIV
jgi:lipopolysaccharide transport system permease protein